MFLCQKKKLTEWKKRKMKKSKEKKSSTNMCCCGARGVGAMWGHMEPSSVARWDGSGGATMKLDLRLWTAHSRS